MPATEQQIKEQAQAIANQAQAIADGKIPADQQPAQSALILSNANILREWVKSAQAQAEQPVTMKLVVINGNGQGDYDVSAHRADCADVPKAIRGHEHFFEEHASKRDAWLDYNGDLLKEKNGAWAIHFYPCTAGLPDGGRYNTANDEEGSEQVYP